MMRSILAALALATLVASTAIAQRVPPVQSPALMDIGGQGRPVTLESAVVTVEPAAGMARTTIEMTLRNPDARVLEGNLQFPLKPGQQVVGFALDVDGRMRDAVPVGKETGRRVFESIEREGVDPGLLEQTAGEFFRLRVYPFPPGGTRRVRVDIVEPLRPVANEATVDLPLAFTAGLDRLEVRMLARMPPRIAGGLTPIAVTRSGAGEYRARIARAAFDPTRGLSLVFPARAGATVQMQSHATGRYFMADVPVDVTSVPRVLPGRVGLLWDSSGSGAGRAHDLEFALLEAYFRAARETEVDLVRLRDVTERPQRFRVRGGDWSALRRALESTVYDGATRVDDFVPDPAVGEYLLFSDGLFNYGRAALAAFANGQRLHAVQAGSGDRARLARLAHARNGRFIPLERRADLAGATRALLEDHTRLLRVEGVGAVDVLAESPDPVDGRLRIAGRLLEADARLILHLAGPGGPTTSELALPVAPDGRMAAWLWARYRLEALQSEPGSHDAAIHRIGTDFGIVTPRTSLIVLERAEDYVRHDIAPPVELEADVDALSNARRQDEARRRSKRIDAIADAWRARVAWWETAFPKGKRPRPVVNESAPVVFDRPSPMDAAAPAPAAVTLTRASTRAAEVGRASLDRVEVTGRRLEAADVGDAATSGTVIRLKPWQSDAPVARRLRGGSPDAVYALYLDERARDAPGPAFYLDVADILFEKQQPALALRVLSNLAELQLEDRHVLRVLAYRLIQADRADLALPVLEHVLAIGGEEPQSYRDLALAHAALAQNQQAVDLLYEVVVRDWDGRFSEIEITALAELNALSARSRAALDTRRIDARLLRNLPVGLRVVLSWDTDNSDMDLHVTDPDGEEAFYGHPATYQGGRLSDDFTGGYGPEEFVLRTPKPGVYKVEAVYFGDRQQVVTGATTLSLWLSTGFGTPQQKDQRITLRLHDRKERIFVGEFEVR